MDHFLDYSDANGRQYTLTIIVTDELSRNNIGNGGSVLTIDIDWTNTRPQFNPPHYSVDIPERCGAEVQVDVLCFFVLFLNYIFTLFNIHNRWCFIIYTHIIIINFL